MKYFALVLTFFAARAAARSVTVTNNCPYTIWYLYTTGSSKPTQATGWEATQSSTVTFDVPDDWTAGRIWGRRDCAFSGGSDSCVDGGCGAMECTATGQPPATLAEFTFGTNGAADFYDVSLVDGFNLPVSITNGAGCHEATCPVDLNANCPSAIAGPFDSSGAAVGCKSACDANLDGIPVPNSGNCCSGDHSTAATCPSSNVQYYSYFKDNCPNSYAYAYDENSGTALWTCASSNAADYTVTFCP
ncbi:thaumatin-like protein [Amylocystis lapponica]|nr:thaumatin-like protein [Amylocystis lapponica]